MGKRSNFPRKPRDSYPTPIAAVKPLCAHLGRSVSFDEPCAGQGHLIQHLENFGHRCLNQGDIEEDARKITYSSSNYFITNPPWDRKLLHAIIDNLAGIKPTWLLIDADWMHTKQAKPYMKYCQKVVSIGRVKWFGDTAGKDNSCWYLFDKKMLLWPFYLFVRTKFYGKN